MRGMRAAWLTALAIGCAAGAPRAALIDGPDTQKQTAELKSILESGGLFQVDVIDTPAQADPNFLTQFDRYKVVILNYGGEAWPVTSMAALEKYVQAGGGLVILPASDKGFPMWPEYQKMLGVGAGANRDEHAGPIWFYKDGNVAYDTTTLGAAGKITHLDPVPVTVRYTEHPITKGLPLTWMHVADDVPGNLRGPGANMSILATVKSDADKGGTGRDEPALIAVIYGKGRVFHTELGRQDQALNCAGFQTILQRGAEWAAAGKVTLKLPADFPTEDKPSTRGGAGGKTGVKGVAK